MMTAHTSTHRTSDPDEGATILIVEDDRVMVDIMRGALEHAGYRVETVETGEEGIAYAQQRIQARIEDVETMERGEGTARAA